MVTSIGALGALLASLTDPRNWTIPAASRAGSHPVRCGGDPATGHVLAATRYPIDHSIVFLANVRRWGFLSPEDTGGIAVDSCRISSTCGDEVSRS